MLRGLVTLSRNYNLQHQLAQTIASLVKKIGKLNTAQR